MKIYQYLIIFNLQKSLLIKPVLKLTKHKNKELSNLSLELINKWKKLKKNVDSRSENKSDKKEQKPSEKPGNCEENYLKIVKIFDSSNTARKNVKKIIFDALINKDKTKPSKFYL